MSLRNALWRGVGLGIYESESAESWKAKDSASRQLKVTRVMGIRRGSVFGVIIDRAETQVEAALRERERRLVDLPLNSPAS
jgi:hypothetical protein